jgi:endonuclease YncB( thermonuclease family)
MRLPIAALLLLLTRSEGRAETIAGRASVIDGDTLEIHGERIRILDIDAPESRQTCTDQDGTEWRCGQRAALALADWIGQQPVACETARKDRYSRWLATCSVGGTDIATWLAGRGWAAPYRDCKCEPVRDASEFARTQRVGIWSGEFIMPWEWRHRTTEPATSLPNSCSRERNLTEGSIYVRWRYIKEGAPNALRYHGVSGHPCGDR